jgi:tetratricopeptide (TPR) repeat protein
MVICCFCFGNGLLLAQAKADPFYYNLFEEGKRFFKEGKLDEALEDFKIAEFGLMDEEAILPELYLYYSLAYLTSGKSNETYDIINKLRTDLKMENADRIPTPAEIKNEAIVMKLVIDKCLQAGDKESRKMNISLIFNFEKSFLEVVNQLNQGLFNNIEPGLKRLESLNKADLRIFYIKGRAAFLKKKYSSAVKMLIKARKTEDLTLRDEAYYYLVLSYYFKGDYKNALTCYKWISSRDLVAKLGDIIQKIDDFMKKTVKKPKKTVKNEKK